MEGGWHQLQGIAVFTTCGSQDAKCFFRWELLHACSWASGGGRPSVDGGSSSVSWREGWCSDIAASGLRRSMRSFTLHGTTESL